MLRITVLNVGHGDSIVIEHEYEGTSYYGVVDSNFQRGKSQRPRALEFLEARGVSRLSFLALTHPHNDHVSGLGDIARHFSGCTDLVLSYPIARDVERFKKLGVEELKRVEEPHRSFVRQLLQVVHEAQKTQFDMMDGLDNKVIVNSFTLGQMEISVVMPPPASKGWLFSDMAEGRLSFGGERQNELSLALLLTYRGKVILLGGDATEKNWSVRAKRIGGSINSNVAKLPHHGSQQDCSPKVLDHIFGNPPVTEEDERIALISANGATHPSAEVLKELMRRGISPYCTSRAKICGGASIPVLVTDNEIDPRLLRDINSYAETPVLEGTCQGDITVSIDSNGGITVTTQFNTPCGFRKGNVLGI